MEHLFLTGAVGCGKTTVIDRVLALVGVTPGGFRTGFGPNRGQTERSLYLWPAAEGPAFDEAHAVARFGAGGVTPLPRRFDALGCACLEGTSPLLVMDECGRLEGDAAGFQGAILRALDGDTPILGVLRQGFPGWTERIAAHPAVAILEVTAENRDGLAEQIVLRLPFSYPNTPVER